MTPKVNSVKGVLKYTQGYDLYLTGSDQVWNCGHNTCFDPIFCNSFTSGVKASYAASIGTERIPEEYVNDFKHYLSEYSFISVRESSAVTALNEIGFENVKEVLDPTLLFNKDDWSKAIGIPLYTGEPYLLIYTVENDKEQIVCDIAKKIAKKCRLKIYYLTTASSFNNQFNYDKIINDATPHDFIYYFINASYSVVSSFHGTAFSINFNIPFFTVLPNKFNTRVVSLLKRYGLENRMIVDVFDKKDYQIDFTDTNAKLTLDRQESTEFLKTITK